MSTIKNLSIRGIRSFGTEKEDEQVSKIPQKVRRKKFTAANVLFS